MIILLGASGYFGEAFQEELVRRKQPFLPVSRSQTDYTQFAQLLPLLRDAKASFVINAAGFTGRPNVDACEIARAETLHGNALLPLTVGHACMAANIPWGHLSSGCIYNGAFVTEQGTTRLETNLSSPRIRALAESAPECFRGFTETDEPNFSFRRPPCSFYSGAKALAEEAILPLGNCYVWRARLPFDERAHSRNLMSKLMVYPKLYDNENSLSHRLETVRACLDLWARRAPFGIYHLVNPGFLTTRQIAAAIQKLVQPGRHFDFWADDAEFYQFGARTLRSNCILDTTKLLQAGVSLRPVHEALLDSLKRWSPR